MELAEVAVLCVVMSQVCRSAKFLAFGPKICPEPNFLLVLIVTLAVVYAFVNGAFLLYFT